MQAKTTSILRFRYRNWALLAAVALVGLLVGAFFRREIDYGFFRLGGSMLSVGPYTVLLSPEWTPIHSNSSTDRPKVLVQPFRYGNELHRTHHLILTAQQFTVPAAAKQIAPRLEREWGSLVLISPNATYDCGRRCEAA